MKKLTLAVLLMIVAAGCSKKENASAPATSAPAPATQSQATPAAPIDPALTKFLCGYATNKLKDFKSSVEVLDCKAPTTLEVIKGDDGKSESTDGMVEMLVTVKFKVPIEVAKNRDSYLFNYLTDEPFKAGDTREVKVPAHAKRWIGKTDWKAE